MAEIQPRRDGITISGTDLNHIYAIRNATEIHLLIWLRTIAVGNTVLLPAAVRKHICEELKISSQNFTNVFGNLKKRGWISGDGGQYIINTHDAI